MVNILCSRGTDHPGIIYCWSLLGTQLLGSWPPLQKPHEESSLQQHSQPPCPCTVLAKTSLLTKALNIRRTLASAISLLIYGGLGCEVWLHLNVNLSFSGSISLFGSFVLLKLS